MKNLNIRHLTNELRNHKFSEMPGSMRSLIALIHSKESKEGWERRRQIAQFITKHKMIVQNFTQVTRRISRCEVVFQGELQVMVRIIKKDGKPMVFWPTEIHHGRQVSSIFFDEPNWVASAAVLQLIKGTNK